MPTPDQIATVRRLNDTARTNPGTGCIGNVTSGFHALADVDRFAALAAIVAFTKWDGDNDPYGEHDFGAIYRLAGGGMDAGPAQGREGDHADRILEGGLLR